ncbi:hypothetical protein ABZP36_012533 [Zizania latifolia]
MLCFMIFIPEFKPLPLRKYGAKSRRSINCLFLPLKEKTNFPYEKKLFSSEKKIFFGITLDQNRKITKAGKTITLRLPQQEQGASMLVSQSSSWQILHSTIFLIEPPSASQQ